MTASSDHPESDELDETIIEPDDEPTAGEAPEFNQTVAEPDEGAENGNDGAYDATTVGPEESDHGIDGEAAQAWSGKARTHPETIGPYSIVKVLGEGGMGTVYLASQAEPVKRLVALKLVRASLASPAAMLRFNAERQAMARLSHPNVAQLFEAGTTDDGFPYFAMENVAGDELHTYCDKRCFTISDRLRLFIDVCRGVQHAHLKGILHRDLKPANVLVADVKGRGVPKIIDFGIAKALDDPLTNDSELTGQRAIGTPAYMSPEALAGSPDLDTRTDVFSLGIVLFELLVGVRPHKSKGSARPQLQPQLNQPIPRPSIRAAGLESDVGQRSVERCGLQPTELARRLRGDLDCIVMTAVAEEADRRYASVADLAADIERHLGNEPVAARPPSTSYLLGKFVRRRWPLVVGATVATVALIMGMVGVSVGLVRARRAEAAAVREAERANREATAAREVSSFLVGLFGVERPEEARGRELTAREVLDYGAARLDTELADQPLIRARLQRVIGNVYGQIDDDEEAVRRLESAVLIHSRELGDNHPETATSRFELAWLRHRLGDLDAAEDLAEKVLAVREARPGETGTNLPDALVLRGVVKLDRGNLDEARHSFERALPLYEAALEPDDPEISLVLSYLAEILDRSGEHEEAELLMRRILLLYESSLPANHPAIAEALNNLAVLVWSQKRYDEAEPLYEEALAIFTVVFGESHAQVATAHSNLGELYWNQGRVELAETSMRRALMMWEENLDADHPDVAYGASMLGGLYLELGRVSEAEALLGKAANITERAFGSEDPDLVPALRQHACALRLLGREREANLAEARAGHIEALEY